MSVIQKAWAFIFTHHISKLIILFMYAYTIYFVSIAIMYYRQAVQLDPDIEFKAYRKPAKNSTL